MAKYFYLVWFFTIFQYCFGNDTLKRVFELCIKHRAEQGRLADQLSNNENTMSGQIAMKFIGDKMTQLRDMSQKRKELQDQQRLEEEDRQARERQSSGNETYTINRVIETN